MLYDATEKTVNYTKLNILNARVKDLTNLKLSGAFMQNLFNIQVYANLRFKSCFCTGTNQIIITVFFALLLIKFTIYVKKQIHVEIIEVLSSF